jgi:7,8-dihydropterin-6-yl-methyl-4-(beta-D-ribofuranosyl)aminobenzene 5'-phosphate synthase
VHTLAASPPVAVRAVRHGAWLAVALALTASSVEAAMDREPRTAPRSLRVTVVVDNVPHAPGLATAWGFAAVVETGAHTLLFDTGSDGEILLANLRRLGVDPASIDAVVLSHIHSDHTGGLDALLARRPGVTVYVPRSFPVAWCRGVERRGARIETVGAARRLCGNVHSTGEMGDAVREQGLIVETPAGLAVVTGCAHPGVVEVARAAKAYLGRGIALLMGGFHLRGRDPAANRATVGALRRLGVRKVAPGHCTGEEATAMFRARWGDDFLPSGCGAVIDVP